jgi:hypothetical protein
MNANETDENLSSEQTIANRCLQSCKKLLAGIEQVKNKIAGEFRELVEANHKSFQLALNEAEALAWQTEYPQLLFPALALEKIQAVATRRARQEALRRSYSVFVEAA